MDHFLKNFGVNINKNWNHYRKQGIITLKHQPKRNAPSFSGNGTHKINIYLHGLFDTPSKMGNLMTPGKLTNYNGKFQAFENSYLLPQNGDFPASGIVSLQEWYILKDVCAFFLGNQRLKSFSTWWVSTHLKHISRIGSFPGKNSQNVWSHHLDLPKSFSGSFTNKTLRKFRGVRPRNIAEHAEAPPEKKQQKRPSWYVGNRYGRLTSRRIPPCHPNALGKFFWVFQVLCWELG